MPVQPRHDFIPIVEPLPLTIGNQVQAALKMFKKAPGTLLVVPLFLSGVSLAIVGPASLEAGRRMELVRTDHLNPGEVMSSWLSDYAVVVVLGLLVSAVVATVLQGAITLATGRACLGRATKVDQALRQSLGRWPALFGLNLINTVFWAAAAAVMFAGLSQIEVYQPDSDAGMGQLGLGLLLLLPALFWSASLAMAPGAIMLEDTGVFKGIGRSWRLAQGGVGRVLGRWLLIGLLGTVPSWEVNYVSSLAPMLGLVLFAPLMQLSTSWQTAMVTLLYIDRRINEGDFAAHIWAAVESDQEPTWSSWHYYPSPPPPPQNVLPPDNPDKWTPGVSQWP